MTVGCRPMDYLTLRRRGTCQIRFSGRGSRLTPSSAAHSRSCSCPRPASFADECANAEVGVKHARMTLAGLPSQRARSVGSLSGPTPADHIISASVIKAMSGRAWRPIAKNFTAFMPRWTASAIIPSMRRSLRFVGFALAAAVGAAVIAVVLQTPLQRLTQPSVVRDVRVVNQSKQPLSIVVVRPDREEVVIRVFLQPGTESTVRLYSGESTSEFDRTEFLFVASWPDRSSRSVCLTGQAIDVLSGIISFSDLSSRGQP